jgi:glycosyltransferase involved in cell wall biosynthesis
MSKVSFIIAARGEKPQNLQRTLDSIYQNATGEFEVIVGFDGEPYFNYLATKDNYKEIRFPSVVGIKTNLNALAAVATGKYLFKLDAHCSVGERIDEIMQEDISDDWIVMPRFKIIKDDWSIQMRDGKEEFYDYFFMHCPLTDSRGYRFKAAGHWPERTQERLDIPIDETPQIHGSGWFVNRDYFLNVLGGFPINNTREFHAQEPAWLALRNWLKGGKVMVNKKTYYAHLHQNGNSRGYQQSKEDENMAYLTVAEHFMMNKESNMQHDIQWFINDKFPNMPTWPVNWEELQREYEKNKINTK